MTVPAFAGLAGKVDKMKDSLPKAVASVKQMGTQAVQQASKTAKSVKVSIQKGLAKRAENKAQAKEKAATVDKSIEGTAEAKNPEGTKTDKPNKDKKAPPEIKRTGFVEGIQNDIDQGMEGIKRETGHGQMFLQGYKMGYALASMIGALLSSTAKIGAKIAMLPFSGNKPGLKAVPGTVASLSGDLKQGTAMNAGVNQSVKNVMAPKSSVDHQQKPGLPKPSATESKITGQKQKMTTPKMGK